MLISAFIHNDWSKIDDVSHTSLLESVNYNENL